MAFVFTSSGDPLVESYWDLVIPGNDITVPFMLVAHVSEPDVVVDQSHVNFGTVLLGPTFSLPHSAATLRAKISSCSLSVHVALSHLVGCLF